MLKARPGEVSRDGLREGPSELWQQPRAQRCGHTGDPGGGTELSVQRQRDRQKEREVSPAASPRLGENEATAERRKKLPILSEHPRSRGWGIGFAEQALTGLCIHPSHALVYWR